MVEDTRYVRMACACGADWIEDRMEPGPSCPLCGYLVPWDQVDDADLSVEGPGMFDVSAGHLIELFGHWGFSGSLTQPGRGRVDVGSWTHGDDRCDPAWKIIVDVAVATATAGRRSVMVGYRVGGKTVLSTTVTSSERLLDLVAAIVRTMREPAPVEAP